MQVNSEAVLASFPVHVVPPAGALPEATQSGMRFLVGRAGLTREISLPWIRARHLVAPACVDLPYGEVADCVEFRCGPVPLDLVREFVNDAREALPNEVAGVFLWNEETGCWRYERRVPTSMGHAHIEFVEVRPGDGEHLVVDVHSHGHFDAFFSQEDDRDDAGSMKLSLVLGKLNQQLPTSKMRLCMAGFVQPAVLNGQGALGVLA